VNVAPVPGRDTYSVYVLVSVSAVTVENLIPDSDPFFEYPDQSGDVVKLGFFQNALLARSLVQNLMLIRELIW
jgi:hypothetical protein